MLVAAVSCAFSRLKTDVAFSDKAWVLDVRVEMETDTPGKVLAVAYTPFKDGQRVAAFETVDPVFKRAVLFFEPGTYRLALVHDKNGNLTIDADEPVEMAEDGRRLKFSDVVKRIDLKMALPKEGMLPDAYPQELASLPDSIPWNGHRMAEKGVGALDVPVPSRHDVVPGSEFLQTVFNTRLKGNVPDHLLFGYEVGSKGDGSVDLNSMLLSEAQDDAVEVRAFEANHVDILSRESVLEFVENIPASDTAAAEETTSSAGAADHLDASSSAPSASSGESRASCVPCDVR